MYIYIYISKAVIFLENILCVFSTIAGCYVHKKHYQLFDIGLKTIAAEPNSQSCRQKRVFSLQQ